MRSTMLKGAVLTIALAMPLAGSPHALAGAAQEPLSLGERIALARLEEVRAVGPVVADFTWPGFDPGAAAAVFYEPGAWALAVGFAEAPAGFAVLEGVKDGADRPVFRAAPGAFHAEGRSPALIAGRWAVLSRFDPPQTIPSGAWMGRPIAEESIVHFIGDAFLIFLMEQRKAASPFPIGPAAYPESAELMALTTIEHRALVAPMQMGAITEKNIGEYHKKLATVVAVRRARAKILGPELTALEREVENTEGLRLYTEAAVYRHAANGTLVMSDLGGVDGSYRNYSGNLVMRLLSGFHTHSFTVDNPAGTVGQVAARGAALATLLDRVGAEWRPRAPAGDLTMVDLLAEKQKVLPENEDSLVQAAKDDNRYDALLDLAQDDLAQLRRDRKDAAERLFPAGSGRLDIVLNGARAATYADDALTTGSLGEGRLTHPGGLALDLAGLKLRIGPAPEPAHPAVMTQAAERRDCIRRITVILPPDASFKVGDKPFRPAARGRPLTPSAPLTIEADGMRFTVTFGTLTKKADGTIEITIAQ